MLTNYLQQAGAQAAGWQDSQQPTVPQQLGRQQRTCLTCTLQQHGLQQRSLQQRSLWQRSLQQRVLQHFSQQLGAAQQAGAAQQGAGAAQAFGAAQQPETFSQQPRHLRTWQQRSLQQRTLQDFSQQLGAAAAQQGAGAAQAFGAAQQGAAQALSQQPHDFAQHLRTWCTLQHLPQHDASQQLGAAQHAGAAQAAGAQHPPNSSARALVTLATANMAAAANAENNIRRYMGVLLG